LHDAAIHSRHQCNSNQKQFLCFEVCRPALGISVQTPNIPLTQGSLICPPEGPEKVTASAFLRLFRDFHCKIHCWPGVLLAPSGRHVPQFSTAVEDRHSRDPSRRAAGCLRRFPVTSFRCEREQPRAAIHGPGRMDTPETKGMVSQ
jgi:hypothetical protein